MTHVTLLNNETRLAASVHGRMDATPILLLHGITMSRDTWDEITPRLRDRYCVWTIDGHGHSARASNYNLAAYVSDAETALAASRNSYRALARRMPSRGARTEQPEC